MSLLVLAFPVLARDDLKRIQSWRQQNDELFYNIVEPHVTIVFAVDHFNQKDFIGEIQERSGDCMEIDFEIDRAIVHKDELSDYYYEFLVPRKGYHDIVSLHDKLYSGILLPHLRKDIQYLPHITIGNSRDKSGCQKHAEELNLENISIAGRLDRLTVVEYSENQLKKILDVSLSRQ